MKIAKILSILFALLAVLLLAGTVALSVTALDAPARLIMVSGDARDLTEQFMEALSRNDYAAAQTMLQGSPDLEADREPETALGSLLWDAYRESISYEFSGGCYVLDSAIVRDVTVTALDIPALMAVLKERSPELLQQAVEQGDPEEIYDGNDDFREAFVMQVLFDGTADLLEETVPTASRTITLKLSCREGEWRILPEQSLLAVLSGGMGR